MKNVAYLKWSTLYVYSMNPSLYRAGRAWKRPTYRKRQQLREHFAHLHKYVAMGSATFLRNLKHTIFVCFQEC